MGLLGSFEEAFCRFGLLVAGQVLKGFLKGQDRLGDVVETEAVGPVPLAGLVLVPDFDDHLGQGDTLAVVVDDDVAKDRGPDGAHFENSFGFCHVPVIPDRLDDTNLYDRTGRCGIYTFRLMLGHPRPREVAKGATFWGERSCRQTGSKATVW